MGDAIGKMLIALIFGAVMIVLFGPAGLVFAIGGCVLLLLFGVILSDLAGRGE